MSAEEIRLVRAGDAEAVDFSPDNIHHLLVDGPDTDGALSSHRVRLAVGGKGAVPHRHDHSTEVFYVIGGRAELLTGDRIVTVDEGDLAVVPPRTPHAFAAAPGSEADLLILLTPGIERFGYFHHLRDIRAGRRDRDSLDLVQDRYDTHFLTSTVWEER